MLSEPQFPSGSSENGSLNVMVKLASGDPMEAGGATSRRRITAGSFKLLTDRLKRKPVSPDETEPVASEARAPEPLSFDMPADIPEIASEPVALAAEPEITALPEFALPAFAPLDPQEPEADVAPEPEPVILAEPEAQHLAAMEPDATLAEPALAVEETSAEVQAAEVAPEPEPVILAEPEAEPLAAMESDATLAEPALAVEETYAEVPETTELPEFETSNYQPWCRCRTRPNPRSRTKSRRQWNQLRPSLPNRSRTQTFWRCRRNPKLLRNRWPLPKSSNVLTLKQAKRRPILPPRRSLRRKQCPRRSTTPNPSRPRPARWSTPC